MTQPGKIVLFGSGETSASGRKVFDWLFSTMDEAPRVAILETPAGFEPNSARVAGRIADFLCERLQNYRPAVQVVPARKRGSAFSPDDEELARAVLHSNVIFLGPGSPSYAARQLQDSAVWQALRVRHWQGGSLVLASAAAIAASQQLLPVYEIYKAGADLHWLHGLDLLASFGLSLTVVPHWNNNDGGQELDTSRCFMGQQRFDQLRRLLPSDAVVIGIDEHTALVLDVAAGRGRVFGRGGVTVQRPGGQRTIEHGVGFDLALLGEFRVPDHLDDIPPVLWKRAETEIVRTAAASVPAQVASLARQREQARLRRDWSEADRLRAGIEALGWLVQDTPDGPLLSKAG
ncbi:MAG: hypothetical protein R2844_18810 [Caldilineales bacterium]